jgi:hypothetical protein
MIGCKGASGAACVSCRTFAVPAMVGQAFINFAEVLLTVLS